MRKESRAEVAASAGAIPVLSGRTGAGFGLLSDTHSLGLSWDHIVMKRLKTKIADFKVSPSLVTGLWQQDKSLGCFSRPVYLQLILPVAKTVERKAAP